jgi:hypothetical protein
MNIKKKLSLVVLLAITLTSLWSASGTLDSSDAIIRERVAHQLVAEKKLVVDSVGDAKKYSTFRDKEGSYLSSWGLGQSVVFLPFEALSNILTEKVSDESAQQERIRLFITSISVFLLCLAINFWLCLKLAIMLRLGKVNAYLISFVATFGSSFWQMAKQGQEEIQLSILLLFSLYEFLCWQRDRHNKHVWFSAISASSTLIFRPTALTILVGMAGIFASELWFNQEKGKSKISTYFGVAYPFAVATFCSLAIAAIYNFFKTRNPLKSGVPFSDFSGNWLNGIIEPTVGLDKGILWTNLWLLPCIICTVLAWRYLKHELKLILFLCLFLFTSSIAIYCKWVTWAGDHTYGARFQVHLVPLLCLSLGAATITYLKKNFHNDFFTKRFKLILLSLGSILFLLQIPSVSFVHNLEIYQALINNAASKSHTGSQTGTLGQVRLRYANFFSKMITGTPVKLDEVNPSAVPTNDWHGSRRWNFWPWLAEKRVSQNVTLLLKMLWAFIVLGSIICWIYAFKIMIYNK